MSRTNSSSDIGGGRASLIVQPTLGEHFRPVYHSVTDSLESRRDEFRAFLASIARYLHNFAVTKSEKSVCQEVIRGRALSIDGLEVLCDLAARSDKPFTLADGIQGAVVQRVAAPPPLCPVDTFLDETRAQSTADVAQSLFIVERTPTRRDQAIDALSTHIHAAKQHVTALLRWPTRKVTA